MGERGMSAAASKSSSEVFYALLAGCAPLNLGQTGRSLSPAPGESSLEDRDWFQGLSAAQGLKPEFRWAPYGTTEVMP